MTPFETINQALEKIGEEHKRSFELDEDGFLTLDWGEGRVATICAPEAGEAFSLVSAMFTLPVDKAPDAVLRELLAYNLPGRLRPGESVALHGDTVLLAFERNADGIDSGALKDAILALGRDAAEVERRLLDFIADLPDASREEWSAGGAAREDGRLDADLSPEDLLRANMLRKNIRP